MNKWINKMRHIYDMYYTYDMYSIYDMQCMVHIAVTSDSL